MYIEQNDLATVLNGFCLLSHSIDCHRARRFFMTQTIELSIDCITSTSKTNIIIYICMYKYNIGL